MKKIFVYLLLISAIIVVGVNKAYADPEDRIKYSLKLTAQYFLDNSKEYDDVTVLFTTDESHNYDSSNPTEQCLASENSDKITCYIYLNPSYDFDYIELDTDDLSIKNLTINDDSDVENVEYYIIKGGSTGSINTLNVSSLNDSYFSIDDINVSKIALQNGNIHTKSLQSKVVSGKDGYGVVVNNVYTGDTVGYYLVELIEKDWLDYANALMKNLDDYYKDELELIYTLTPDHLDITYLSEIEDEEDIIGAIRFNYSGGVITYTSDVTKADLDAITDEDERFRRWSTALYDSSIIKASVYTLIEQKGYTNVDYDKLLSDSMSFTNNGIEYKTLSYVFIEDASTRLSGDIVKSLKLDIKNGLKNYPTVTEEDNKETTPAKDDKKQSDSKTDKKNGNIGAEDTGIGVPVVAISLLSGGFITLRKKNILNRL